MSSRSARFRDRWCLRSDRRRCRTVLATTAPSQPVEFRILCGLLSRATRQVCCTTSSTWSGSKTRLRASLRIRSAWARRSSILISGGRSSMAVGRVTKRLGGLHGIPDSWSGAAGGGPKEPRPLCATVRGTGADGCMLPPRRPFLPGTPHAPTMRDPDRLEPRTRQVQGRDLSRARPPITADRHAELPGKLPAWIASRSSSTASSRGHASRSCRARRDTSVIVGKPGGRHDSVGEALGVAAKNPEFLEAPRGRAELRGEWGISPAGFSSITNQERIP